MVYVGLTGECWFGGERNGDGEVERGRDLSRELVGVRRLLSVCQSVCHVSLID